MLCFQSFGLMVTPFAFVLEKKGRGRCSECIERFNKNFGYVVSHSL